MAIAWHRVFGMALTQYFAGSGWEVDVEVYKGPLKVVAERKTLKKGENRFVFRQTVEDVVHFSETTMPLLSTLVAGSVAYYFGAQSGTPNAPPSDSG